MRPAHGPQRPWPSSAGDVAHRSAVWRPRPFDASGTLRSGTAPQVRRAAPTGRGAQALDLQTLSHALNLCPHEPRNEPNWCPDPGDGLGWDLVGPAPHGAAGPCDSRGGRDVAQPAGLRSPWPTRRGAAHQHPAGHDRYAEGRQGRRLRRQEPWETCDGPSREGGCPLRAGHGPGAVDQAVARVDSDGEVPLRTRHPRQLLVPPGTRAPHAGRAAQGPGLRHRQVRWCVHPELAIGPRPRLRRVRRHLRCRRQANGVLLRVPASSRGRRGEGRGVARSSRRGRNSEPSLPPVAAAST